MRENMKWGGKKQVEKKRVLRKKDLNSIKIFIYINTFFLYWSVWCSQYHCIQTILSQPCFTFYFQSAGSLSVDSNGATHKYEISRLRVSWLKKPIFTPLTS